jgi:hypothetical protein
LRNKIKSKKILEKRRRRNKIAELIEVSSLSPAITEPEREEMASPILVFFFLFLIETAIGL